MTPLEVFDTSVIRKFQFLVDDFGFSRSGEPITNESGERRQRYELGTWFVTPYYDTYENGINVEFGDGLPVPTPLTVHLYMRLVDPAMYYQLGYSIARDVSDIGALLDLYAHALLTSGVSILNRDDAICSQMVQAMKLGEGMCPSYSEQPSDGMIVSKYV
jgi:hypothetical protein